MRRGVPRDARNAGGAITAGSAERGTSGGRMKRLARIARARAALHALDARNRRATSASMGCVLGQYRLTCRTWRHANDVLIMPPILAQPPESRCQTMQSPLMGDCFQAHAHRFHRASLAIATIDA